MLTVKHIAISGRETVWSATEATYWPFDAQIEYDADAHSQSACAKPRVERPRHPYVSVCRPDGDSPRLIDGTVFLMNAQGATVSRWDLGASPVPLRDDVTGTNCTQKIAA